MADRKHPVTEALPTVAWRYVFVYGTLRRGEQRDINLLRPSPIFIANGQTSGMLYDLGAYPGLRLGGSQSVQGEVYQITAELERQLDEIEEVWPQKTGEYAKRLVRVRLRHELTLGEQQTCLVYEIAPQRIVDRPLIASGDWLMR